MNSGLYICRAVGTKNAPAPAALLMRYLSSRAVASVTIPQPAKAATTAQKPSVYNRTTDEIRRDNRTGEESIYKLGKHRSNAMELVHKVPIVEVDGDMAICDGGGGALGHPLEYISLKRPGAVEYCKYCALRYTKKKGSH